MVCEIANNFSIKQFINFCCCFKKGDGQNKIAFVAKFQLCYRISEKKHATYASYRAEQAAFLLQSPF